MNFQLPAILTKKNVLKYLKKIQAQNTAITNKLIIDGSQVEQIDSAGIALLLELKSIKNIDLANLSPNILRLADLYRLDLNQQL